MSSKQIRQEEESFNTKDYRTNQENGFLAPQERKLLNKIDKQTGGTKNKTDEVDYVSMLLNLHQDTTVVHFPMYNFQPRFCLYKRATVEYQVNASGNLYMHVNPAYFASVQSGSTAVPYIVLNNSTYDNVDNPSAIVGNTGLTDLSTYNALSVASGDFAQVLTTGYNCEFCITGVSMLNRKGMLTLVEEVSDDLITISNSVAGNTNINTWIASGSNSGNIRRSILTKLPNKTEFDLAEPLETHVYRWFPNYGGMSAHNYDYPPSATSDSISLSFGTLFKKLHLFISGADASTKIRITHTIAYSTTPNFVNYDKFPVSWPNCFQKPDTLLSKLASDTTHIFHHKGGH